MLELNGVNAGYGSFQALFDISLEVKAGEAVAVIGPNGAGKTTLMRVISGMTAPFSGALTMEGQSLGLVKPHEIVDLGIAHVPENRRLFPGMTVEDNLKLGAFAKKARGDSDKNLNFVYELFPRMKERRDQLAGTMSGGEQQMLAIARGMMGLPKLLMVDEPFLGLSPIVMKDLIKIFKDIVKEGVSILFVEQNVRLALSMADRGYVLESGRLVIDGNSKDLIDNDKVTKVFLGN